MEGQFLMEYWCMKKRFLHNLDGCYVLILLMMMEKLKQNGIVTGAMNLLMFIAILTVKIEASLHSLHELL